MWFAGPVFAGLVGTVRQGQVGAAPGVCTALWCPVDRQVLELLSPAITSPVEAAAL